MWKNVNFKAKHTLKDTATKASCVLTMRQEEVPYA